LTCANTETPTINTIRTIELISMRLRFIFELLPVLGLGDFRQRRTGVYAGLKLCEWASDFALAAENLDVCCAESTRKD
jgi:hypothetical protein